MSAVRFADSLKYGTVIFGYFVGITVLGLGGIALGALVAVPELSAWLDGDSVEQVALAGGIVLMTFGAAVWFSGLFAIARKLLADAVSVGVADGQGEVTVRLPASEAGAVREPTRTVRRENRTDDQSRQSGTAATREVSVRDRRDASAVEETPSSASGSGADTESGEGVPRTEAEAGERGWSGTERGPGDESVEGPPGRAGDPARNPEGDGDGTEAEQTAEDIAFGNPREDEAEPTTDEEGDVARQSSTTESAGSSETSAGDTDGAADLWETVGTSDGEQDENPADSTAEPGSEEDSPDSDGTAGTGHDGEADPFVDRPTDE